MTGVKLYPCVPYNAVLKALDLEPFLPINIINIFHSEVILYKRWFKKRYPGEPDETYRKWAVENVFHRYAETQFRDEVYNYCVHSDNTLVKLVGQKTIDFINTQFKDHSFVPENPKFCAIYYAWKLNTHKPKKQSKVNYHE